ncbi:Gfo/Idh/MocA family protein [Klebsiella pneumoniae]|uniref:Gfo/Idh/MocA family protein n=1 Tax=Klebsiella pneumoniae TaxID=573 RepID=UPI001ABC42F1|nr:Gfo/Idh/MocA family oxidoreductase [Klebsiella pneumoniae]MBO3721283.1 Gfo/Idh/MocA family oxidoreductase [Klebsiella pneumoniae]HCM5830595.1 Gfo/Idh/MocA family oxidoreductase [Klebsiella pneumoniae]
MTKLKIGIVGCGGIANNKHFPSLKAVSEDVELVAFCDVIKERAEKACAEFGTENAKTYTDYKLLLQDKTIDIVYVLTPNNSHCPITVAAFEAGKHVMCEKPMAATSVDAERMMHAWKRSGKQFTIGYQNRFRKDVQTLRKACDENALGDIYFAKAHAVRRRAVPTWGVFQDKEQQGGGPLIDIGTHALDITLWMMGNYKPVSVTGSVFHKMADKTEGNVFGPWDPETFDVEDSAFGFIKMENGATIFLESAWVLNTTDAKEASTTLCGTEGGAEIIHGMGISTGRVVINKSQYGQLVTEEPTSMGGVAFFDASASSDGVLEAIQWIDAVKNNKQPLVKPEEAYVVTCVLEAIYKSNETGETIKLGDSIHFQ